MKHPERVEDRDGQPYLNAGLIRQPLPRLNGRHKIQRLSV
jgi:hypothetical protein